MSRPQPPEPAKLVIGLLLKEHGSVAAPARMLSDAFGPIDTVSPWLPFDYTDYYAAEMDGPLFRRMFAFNRLIAQSDLAHIKRCTNDIEKKYSRNGKRDVNIDPGYLLRERFVLATGKNYSHRIYIGKGIYADLTLIYRKGGFQALEWTYPDYADTYVQDFLQCVRKRYVMQLKRKTRL